jgi:hypothetical protein
MPPLTLLPVVLNEQPSVCPTCGRDDTIASVYRDMGSERYCTSCRKVRWPNPGHPRGKIKYDQLLAAKERGSPPDGMTPLPLAVAMDMLAARNLTEQGTALMAGFLMGRLDRVTLHDPEKLRDALAVYLDVAQAVRATAAEQADAKGQTP